MKQRILMIYAATINRSMPTLLSLDVVITTTFIYLRSDKKSYRKLSQIVILHPKWGTLTTPWPVG